MKAVHLSRSFPIILSVLAALLCTASVSQATIIGTTVSGGFFFNGDPTTDNQFDPANGGSGTSAVIGVASPTFSTIVNGEDFNLSADFTESQMDISFAPYRVAGTFDGFVLTFSDSAFAGLNLSLLSFGGPFTSTDEFSYSLSGDTITFNVIDGLYVTAPDYPYTADLSLTSSPEPSSITFAAVGLLIGLAGMRQKQRSGRTNHASSIAAG